MKHRSVEEIAREVFGDRFPLAERYRELLATEGTTRGLIGPREADRLWERHILNSAVVQELIPPDAAVVDIGSGAGLPGIPLALARPDLSVTLVEPLARRTVFLEAVAAELEPSIRVVRGRAEAPDVRKKAGNCDVVVSRAVAPLAKLSGWSLPLLRAGGEMLAMKGSSAAEEIERDRAEITRIGGRDLSILSCGSGLLDPPTIVVRAVRGARGVSAPKK
ncbi:16S rRNA (guanine(527)-N(7))-methyltransferase RsmG [Millisia brevis]|uniref:16S rRNA (guanine(527)-N(7))-methyltransferase RsmG n=1 Tax=Millisia brevis TaxID=264148 RepID=UPI00082CC0DB|nr:16S rRNA (guanine(527)-N(7))-methyltransferase RsmG [Millisia brevis]